MAFVKLFIGRGTCSTCGRKLGFEYYVLGLLNGRDTAYCSIPCCIIATETKNFSK